MKNVLKIGVLAMALGLFAVACNSGTNSGNNADSLNNTEMSAPATTQPAPADTMPVDTSNTDTSNM